MKLKFLVFLVIALSAALLLSKHDVTHTGIETSRLASVESVLERGTFAIDDSFFTTPDKVERDGHFYGDKPPLPTFLAIAWGKILRVSGVRFLRDDYGRAVYLTNVIFFILSSLTGWLFYLGLRRRKRMPEGYRIVMSVLSAASTLVLSYSVTLNNHTLCAVVLMGLILLLERCEETGWSVLRGFFAGLLTGLAFNLDFVTGGVLGISVFILALTSMRTRRFVPAAAYAAGACFMLFAEAGMNVYSYGSPLPLYLESHHPAFRDKNYFAYAFNILFGFEGFFLYMPALLFAGCACASERFRHDRVFLCMMWSAAASAVLLVIGTSDYGGWCYGYRFLIPFAPVLLYYAVLYFGRPRPKLKRWHVFRAALLWGVVFSLVGTLNPWNAGYEGSSTPENALPEKFKNGFLANAFVFCWRNAPESAVTQLFLNRIYDREYAMLYLMMELNNRNDRAGLMKLAQQLNMDEADREGVQKE